METVSRCVAESSWPMAGWQAGSADYAAAACIVVGMVCQLFARRLRPGLGTSLFVCATTAGIALAAAGRTWGLPTPNYVALRVTSALCLGWALLGWLAAHTEKPSPGDSHDSSATLLAWTLVTGIAAAVQAVYLLVFNTWSRVVDPESFGEGLLSSGGMLDLGALTATVLLWRSTVRRPTQPVILLGLAALGVWWTSLMIPAPGGQYARSWWDWTFHLQFGLATLLVFAAVLQDFRYRRKRRTAWPDRMADLLEPYSRWPAYIQIESIIAASVLILGVYQIVRHGPPSLALGVASMTACAMAGVTCLFMIYRRWSGNTAGLGIALLTLAVVVSACTAALIVSPYSDYSDYGARMSVFYIAALFALALMIAWWAWLARFWQQQLLDGVAWTTTGRLIPYAKQAAFLIGALAVLVSFQLALWPSYLTSADDESRPARLATGLAAMGLLILVNGRWAYRDDKHTVAGLTLALVFAAVTFIFVRLPPSPFRGWLKQYDVVVLAGMALPMLAIAEALPGSRWRCFAGPLWIVALLILPVWSMLELSRSGQPTEWVRPLSLALLGALYSFAGSREHRRAFLVLGAVLLLASLSGLYRSYLSSTIVSSGYLMFSCIP